MLLSIPNSFTSNTTILSASVNTNFSTIASWANGNIQQDNFGTFSGALNWTITGNNLALSIASASTTGMIVGALTGILASTKSALDLSSAAAQSTGRALAYLNLSNAASTIPALQLDNAGTGSTIKAGSTGTGAPLEVVSTTAASVPAPKMTTTQRNAIASPVTGSRIYNTTTNQPEFYNGSSWAAFYGGATTVDGSTLEVSGTSIRVKDAGIITAKIADSSVTTAKIADSNVTTVKLADGNVTRAKLASVGQQVSASSSTFTHTGDTAVTPITNLSVTITTTGRPVILMLIPDGTGLAILGTQSSTSSASTTIFELQRGGAAIADWEVSVNGAAGNGSLQITPTFVHFDPVGAGTYIYAMYLQNTASTTTGYAERLKLVAYEV